MRQLQYLCGTLILALASACSAVSIEEPMGVAPVQAEPEDWEGYWTAAGEVVGWIEVVDAASGILGAVWLEDGEPHATRIYLGQAGSWTFASVLLSDDDYAYTPDTEPDSSGVSAYFWVRINKDGDTLLFWEPDVDKFRSLVREGSLPGRLDSPASPAPNVILGPLGSNDYAFLASDAAGVPFVWDRPFVLTRLR